jgi:hypothetical protein
MGGAARGSASVAASAILSPTRITFCVESTQPLIFTAGEARTRKGGSQEKLFYSFNRDDRVPSDHLLRGIDRFFDPGDLRQHLAPYYSNTGRPSQRVSMPCWTRDAQ